MFSRSLIIALIALTIQFAHGEILEMECGFIELTDKGLQCEFNNIFTFDSSHVNIIERNTSIDSVSFRQSELYSVPSDIFVKFPYVKHLDVELTQLKVIKADNFRNANQLKYFLARFNDITTLESETFFMCPELKFIVLQYNKINSIHPNAFSGLNKLEALYLDYNRMISLPAPMLNSVPNLLHFSISHNNLTSIPDNFFDKTDKLESMNLAHNLLQAFDGKQFDNLPNLEGVQLEHNNLTKLDLVTCKSTAINVDNNQLEEIELNKWTRMLSAWNNPVRKLILHEHYGTGRHYNFSFNEVNEIVFFVHEQCCALENLENFYIITRSIGDLAQKKFKIDEWTCRFVKTIGYETNNGFVTNNICTRYVRGMPTTTTRSTTTTPTRSQMSTEKYRNSNTASRGSQTEDSSSENDRFERTTNSDDLFTGFVHDADMNNETYNATVEESSDIPEIKLEKSYWQRFKSSMSNAGKSIKSKWNEWTG